jgi:hypothetical protein
MSNPETTMPCPLCGSVEQFHSCDFVAASEDDLTALFASLGSSDPERDVRAINAIVQRGAMRVVKDEVA